MNKILKLSFIVLLITIGSQVKAATGTNPGEETKSNDTTIGAKSNIVIFKLITSSSTSNNNSGSLKKAGKVARTSYSHTSIENILYKKKGI